MQMHEEICIHGNYNYNKSQSQLNFWLDWLNSHAKDWAMWEMWQFPGTYYQFLLTSVTAFLYKIKIIHEEIYKTHKDAIFKNCQKTSNK